MIPKIIHYCWFGGNPLPRSAIKFIESWRRFFPDYEIKEWNEDNYDVNSIPYTRQAYEAKKYAFVSDYARFKILYEHGGLYFDTDVEVIRSMDDIVANGPFMGFEMDYNDENHGIAVAPGLGLGAYTGMDIYRIILDKYSKLSFFEPDGKLNTTTVVTYTTNILLQNGLENTSKIQNIGGIYIYPKEYFAPKDYTTGKLTITQNTRTIHHYDSSWHTPYEKIKEKIAKLLGPKLRSVILFIKHRNIDER